MVAEARQDLDRNDGADEDVGCGPERTCVATRTRHAPEDLIRFVRAPDGAIVPDLAGRLPGRGVWVSCTRDAVATAVRNNAFARSLKAAVNVPADLDALLEALMVRRTADALSLAVKAGQVVTGFTKVEIAIARGQLGVLMHASDAATDGRGKLDRKLAGVLAAAREAAAGGDPRGGVPIVDVLSTAEMSLATGRSNVVHAALMKGGAAWNFTKEAERLRRYRSNAGSTAAIEPRKGLDTDQV